uniref:Target of rapamycin complex subunit lst8 n=1 Tax=Panagrolaimus sp. JU765 TaxID=591449 RepID=A0AC34PX99_9BILA
MAVSSTGKYLAIGGFQSMRIFDFARPIQPLQVQGFNVHERNITSIGFNQDGSWMFTGAEDCTAKIWDLRSNTVLCQRILQLNSSVNSVVVHPNQRELIVADSTGGIYIWDIRRNRDDSLTTELTYTEFILDLDTDREGKQVAAITNKGSCFLYSNLQDSMLASEEIIENPEINAFEQRTAPVVKFKPHEMYGLKCKFSPMGTMLATCAGDDYPKLWNVKDLTNKNSDGTVSNITLRDDEHFNDNKKPKWIWGLEFSNDSRMLFAGGTDTLVRGYDLHQGGICTRRMVGHTKGITAMALFDTAPIC